MRIVDVNEFYSPTGGGVRTYLDRKMGILADMGHELIVIACGTEDRIEERPGGGKIYWLKSPKIPIDKNYGFLWDPEPVIKLLDELDPDVVEASSPGRSSWIVGKWWQGGRALKVFFAHNDNFTAYVGRWFEDVATLDQLERWFSFLVRYMGNFLSHYDAFVTNGETLARRFRDRGYHVDAAAPLGIDRGFFSPDLRDERLRVAMLEQCGLPPEGKLLIGVGRHHPEKRWPCVIDAVERAGESMPVGLMLLGDGSEREKLARRVAGSPHIKLFRPVYDRLRFAKILASADALIHGSDAEPFGLVALEAVASGLPLIVPDEGGAFDIAEPPFAGAFNAIIRLFHDEREARAAAFAAIKDAVASGGMALEAEKFFLAPLHIADFADFEARYINTTHTAHRLSSALRDQVEKQLKQHMTAKGADFQIPMRVDLLRKQG